MNFCGKLGYSFDLSDDWAKEAVTKSNVDNRCLDMFKNVVNQAHMAIYLDSLDNLDAFQMIYEQIRDDISKKCKIFEENCNIKKNIAVVKAYDESNGIYSIYCFFEIVKNILGHIVLEVRELDDADILSGILETWDRGGNK